MSLLWSVGSTNYHELDDMPAVAGDDVCMFQRFSMAKSAEPEPRENGLLLKPTANLTLRQYIVSEVDVSLQSAVGA